MPERKTVVPGELIGRDKKAGENTYRDGDSVYASVYGFKNDKGREVEVLPIRSSYIPNEGDKVIGIVTDVNFNCWYLDINSPYDARLPISLHPEYIETGDLEQHLRIDDAVIVEVTEVDKEKNVSAKMDEKGLKKLESGRIIEISPPKVPRVIGKNASMISMLKRETNCDLYVGQNGRIWVSGSECRVNDAINAIKMIEKKSNISGLTDKIRNYLKEEEE
ncbi:MAG: Exosome complex RNA-binding protein Rrp4 containing S1 and KH domain [Candidatus Methanohalarchaeum thermophilum]|uniref:Exosome complex component Rrp4 n=1 Tax=Methanohalarchaeum thermophilum TaxID=1903181 RepID=A0A1Q6DVS7_METT1|nr:MAG: Exosome complex RNA-binding protein Rrp4 containing S1 and KH domain [Candidatus Methanohalarchaeum thermophilum]